MSDNDVDSRELEDLKAFVASDGYKRYLAHVEREWGPEAQMRKIDDVLTALTPGNVDGELSTVSQVRAAAKQIQKVVHWPETRIQQLKGEKPKTMNPMELLRRRPR